MSCSITQHSNLSGSEALTSKTLIPSLTLYQLSHYNTALLCVCKPGRFWQDCAIAQSYLACTLLTKSHQLACTCATHGCTTIGRKPFRRYDNWSHTTSGRCDISLSTTFGRKNSQVRHLVEIVNSLFFNQTSYSMEFRIYQMSLIIKKKENHEKSLC